jgi:hypothetical protein
MLVPLQSKSYIVKPGDNLDSIARANGYRSWEIIYKSKCNQRLRLTRLNPNLIKVGDVVALPPRAADIMATLQTRLERLRATRLDAESLFAQMLRELDAEFKKLELVAAGVDTANDVVNILRGVGKMCYQGYRALDKGAEELSRANKELAKEALDLPKEQLETLTLKTFAEQLDQPETVKLTNTLWVFSAIVVQSWLDITSPSYWAGAIAELQQGSSIRTALTRRPAEVYLTARANLVETRRKALEQIDGKLRDTERLVNACRGEICSPLRMR